MRLIIFCKKLENLTYNDVYQIVLNKNYKIFYKEIIIILSILEI